jgi:hypothetical protein
MFPVPVAVQDEPELATQVHVAEANDAGSESVTVAFAARDGPRFVTTIVYTIGEPCVYVVCTLVLAIARSVSAVSVSISVAVSLVLLLSATPMGAAIEAVLTSVPIADGEIAAVNV